ncbi:oligosaccharide flippase family protein [Gottfriedia sp. S16(2024)]|uniref:oligosaccharide flippase family protein n=1 Tax=Gottfriedia sp. S16(2024) TaxID=3162883 RepID=UPI003D2260BF
MTNSNLLNKFLEYALGSGIVLLLGLISSPINTRLFSPNEFGKYSMFILFSSLIGSIILMGLDNSFVRFFYEEEKEGRAKLLKASLKLPILLVVISSLLLIIFCSSILNQLFNEFNIQLIILIIINNFFSLLSRYMFLVVRMQQKGRIYSYLQIAQKALNIILIIVFFKFFDNNFLALVYSFVISQLIACLIGMLIEKEIWFSMFKSNQIKTTNIELLKYGFPLVFTYLITWLFQSIDRIAIKHFKDFKELGLYAAAFSIVALLNAVQGAFTTFWVPVAFEKFSKNPNDKQFFEKVSRLVAFTMFFIGTLIILFKDIIIYLLGNEYRGASYIMPFLIFMPIMYTISETTVIGINFQKKSSMHIIIAIIAALVNLIGNLLLVPNYGAVGAAISTGIAYIIFFYLRTIISKKYFKINYGLTKIFISTLCLFVLAFYASFNNVDIISILLGVLNLFVIVFLYYKDIFNLFSFNNLIKKN